MSQSGPVRQVLLDANVVLRLLLDDHDTLSARAAAVFDQAAAGRWRLLLSSVALAECVYTLRSVYKLGRSEVASSLLAVLSLPGVEGVEDRVARSALKLFSERNVDFADAYLAALALDGGLGVASFDRDLEKLGAALVAEH